MAHVKYSIAIARAQRAMNHARTVTHDLSVMPHYRPRIHTYFTDGVMMVEKKKFTDITLTTDGSCLTTHSSYVCSIATSMLRHVGASKPSSIWVTPPEALWRIYGFDISDRPPSMLSLQLHLHDMHMVSFHQREGV
jgi:hypothetical protein